MQGDEKKIHSMKLLMHGILERVIIATMLPLMCVSSLLVTFSD